LFRLALSLIDQANANGPIINSWTFGGGTALMLQIDHRESHDIDLFLDDPQRLAMLNPQTQGYLLDPAAADYVSDGSSTLRLVFDMGEIDFICCGSLTDPATKRQVVEGRAVDLETPAEIVAKKLFYRGGRMQPRDMFDIAAVIRRLGETELIAGLLPYRDRCVAALQVADRMDPGFAHDVMVQLMIRQGYEDLPETAQGMTVEFLKRVVAS
jgi:hypothetical protein